MFFGNVSLAGADDEHAAALETAATGGAAQGFVMDLKAGVDFLGSKVHGFGICLVGRRERTAPDAG
ncbi:hypothetical protein D3C81_977260 [compost metagenome]